MKYSMVPLPTKPDNHLRNEIVIKLDGVGLNLTK
jgi:hypothetical protein